jgi:hypothetical protein
MIMFCFHFTLTNIHTKNNTWWFYWPFIYQKIGHCHNGSKYSSSVVSESICHCLPQSIEIYIFEQEWSSKVIFSMLKFYIIVLHSVKVVWLIWFILILSVFSYWHFLKLSYYWSLSFQNKIKNSLNQHVN